MTDPVRELKTRAGILHAVLSGERNVTDFGTLDPRDPDWRRLGFDWVQPAGMAARTRLYGALLAHYPREKEA
jgi:hypothetical protein